MPVRWTSVAAEDLEAIFVYIAFDNPEAAGDMMEALLQGAERLVKFPALGRTGRVAGTRELIVAPYVVVYRVLEDSVLRIEAVMHGAQRF